MQAKKEWEKLFSLIDEMAVKYKFNKHNNTQLQRKYRGVVKNIIGNYIDFRQQELKACFSNKLLNEIISKYEYLKQFSRNYERLIIQSHIKFLKQSARLILKHSKGHKFRERIKNNENA